MSATFRLMLPFLLLAVSARAPAAAPLDFARDILPMLERNCLPCHNATKSEGDFIMETPQLMLRGGEHGAAIQPGRGSDSLLYQTAARSKKPYMPPADNKSKAKALTSQQLELLRRWIDEGAQGHGKTRETPKWQAMPSRVVAVSAVAVTFNGTLAAIARGNRVTIYDLLLNQLAFELPPEAHHDIVSSLVFSPDGATLASGSFGEVKLWSLVPQEVRPSQHEVPAASPAEARSPDGKRIANTAGKLTGGDGKTVIAELIRDRAQEDARLKGAQASLAASFELSWQKGELERCEARIKQLRDDAAKAAGVHADFVKRKSDIEKKIAEARAVRDARLKERELADAEVSKLAPETPAGTDAAKALDEATKKQKEAASRFNEAAKALSEAMSETGKAQDAERTARKAEEDLADESKKLKLVQTALAAAQSALAAADKRVAEERNTATKQASPIRSITFSEDSLSIYTTHEDGCVRAWSAAEGAPLWTLKVDAQPLGGIKLVGDQLIVARHVGTVGIMPKRSWALAHQLGDATSAKSPLTDRVNALAFSPDGRWLATGSGDPSRTGEIKLWNPADGKLVREFDRPHKDAVLALDFSSDGKLLASGSADHAVRVWEAASGRLVRHLEAHSNHVLAVSFRSDGRVLASAGADAAIRTWTLDTGDVLKTISDFKKEVTGVRYIEMRDQLACAAGDPELRLLNDQGAKSRSDVADGKAFLTTFTASSDGRVRVVGDMHGHVWVLDSTGKVTGSFVP